MSNLGLVQHNKELTYKGKMIFKIKIKICCPDWWALQVRTQRKVGKSMLQNIFGQKKDWPQCIKTVKWWRRCVKSTSKEFNIWNLALIFPNLAKVKKMVDFCKGNIMMSCILHNIQIQMTTSMAPTSDKCLTIHLRKLYPRDKVGHIRIKNLKVRPGKTTKLWINKLFKGQFWKTEKADHNYQSIRINKNCFHLKQTKRNSSLIFTILMNLIKLLTFKLTILACHWQTFKLSNWL